MSSISDIPCINQSEVANEELRELSSEELDSNWNLHNYFGHIKVITTNTESERFKRFEAEVKKIGQDLKNYKIVRGVNGSTLHHSIWTRMVRWQTEHLLPEELVKRLQGQTACFLSQYKAIKNTFQKFRSAVNKLNSILAKKHVSPLALHRATKKVRKYSSLLIIEDNTGFGSVTGSHSADIKNFGTLFRKAMRELKPGWDLFYFMTMSDGELVSCNLAKIHYGMTTKCYAINYTMYERILQALEIITMDNKELKPVDHEIASLHQSCNAYASVPSLAYRFASESLVYSHMSNLNPAPIKNWQPQVNILQREDSF